MPIFADSGPISGMCVFFVLFTFPDFRLSYFGFYNFGFSDFGFSYFEFWDFGIPGPGGTTMAMPPPPSLTAEEARATAAVVTQRADETHKALAAEDSPGVGKRAWTEAEDMQLVETVSKFGTEHWTLIASHMTGRVGKQCRERWTSKVRPPPDRFAKRRASHAGSPGRFCLVHSST